MATEIERVFLLTDMPAGMPSGETLRIEQGYLAPAPAEAIAEGRLRRTKRADGTVVCHHTVKSGVGRVREEVERVISEQEFIAAWPRTAGKRIRKERTRVPVGARVWEVDRFLDLPLVLAECELEAPDEPLQIPPWMAPSVIREVTEEPEYRNYHLAVQAGLSGGHGTP